MYSDASSPTMKNSAPFSLREPDANHDPIADKAITVPPMPTTNLLVKNEEVCIALNQ
jgi:hypothetical protein